MFDSHALALGSSLSAQHRPRLYPDDDALRAQNHALNELICVAINNGAYKAGFSSDQKVYAAAFEPYFTVLARSMNCSATAGLFCAVRPSTKAICVCYPRSTAMTQSIICA